MLVEIFAEGPVQRQEHQRRRIDADLLGEIRQGRPAAQANDLAVALRDVDAADDRGIPHLEFLALRPTRLALLRLAAALTEGTCGTTAGAAATTAAAAGSPPSRRCRCRPHF